MPTLAQVEQQILDREGFRVELVPFRENEKRFPAYDYPVMGSNKWRISDWKAVRLAAYIAQIRSVAILRGDGTIVRSDLRLGALRDSYFEATYPALPPSFPSSVSGNVLQFKAPSTPRLPRR